MLDRTSFTEQTKTRDAGWSRLAAALQHLGRRIDADRQALVIAHDVTAAVLALLIAFMLRENALVLSPTHIAYVVSTLPLAAISALAATLLFGSHRAVWCYLGVPEIIRLAQMALFTVLVFQLGQFLIDRLDGMPRTVPPLQFLVMMSSC